MNATIRSMGVTLALALAVAAACGIKKPPLPPRPAIPPPVADLDYRLEGDALALSWTLPLAKGADPDSMDACRVYRAVRPAAEAECRGCPVRYERAGDVAVPVAAGAPVRMHYAETVEPGFAYIYKVVCRSINGAVGGDSNLIRFDHPPAETPVADEGNPK